MLSKCTLRAKICALRVLLVMFKLCIQLKKYVTVLFLCSSYNVFEKAVCEFYLLIPSCFSRMITAFDNFTDIIVFNHKKHQIIYQFLRTVFTCLEMGKLFSESVTFVP